MPPIGSPSHQSLRAGDRLRADFHLSIVVLFGAVSSALILPFGVYRLHTGAWLVALLDGCIVLLVVGACTWAWRRGDARRVGAVLAVLYNLGALLSSALLGVAGVFWIYAVVMGNFFLLRWHSAAALTLATIACVVWQGSGLESRAEAASFIATALLVGFLSYILASRTEAQRVELEKLASHDPLTGVHNRRALSEELALAADWMARGGPTPAIVLLDVDHFKRINDLCGHATGDAVLVEFCAVLRRHVRSVDRLFRFGGEEFVLLLASQPTVGLQAFADRLIERVRGELGSPLGPVTVSAGAACLKQGESWEEWLRRADEVLYRAKSNGRDRADVAN